MPVMDIIISALFLQDNIRVTCVELAMEFRVLLHRFELLDSIDFERVLSSLSEESLSLLLELSNILSSLFSIEHSIVVVSFNHFDEFLVSGKFISLFKDKIFFDQDI